MALRGTRAHYRISEIQRRHFNATAHQCGLGQDMEAIIEDTPAKTPQVIAQVEARLPGDFPADVFESVKQGLQEAAGRLEQS
jgi:serine/threonine-protein kinase HipA